MKFNVELEDLEKFFAFEYANMKPDIVPIAKGIGGGVSNWCGFND